MYGSPYSIHVSAHLLIPEIENNTDHADFKIKSTQPGLQIYSNIDCYLLAIICGTLCINK